MNATKKSLVLLLLVFVAPVLVGTVLFFNLERFGFDKGSTNYGTLVHPAQPAIMADLKQASGDAIKDETIGKRWTLTYIAPSDCDQTCLDKLTLIKKVRLLTNEKMRRVRTLFVSKKATVDAVDKGKFPDMVFTYVDGQNSAFIKQFPVKDSNPIYLIDPLGNIMMYYSQDELNAKKMIKDLNRLLKYSKLG